MRFSPREGDCIEDSYLGEQNGSADGVCYGSVHMTNKPQILKLAAYPIRALQ